MSQLVNFQYKNAWYGFAKIEFSKKTSLFLNHFVIFFSSFHNPTILTLNPSCCACNNQLDRNYTTSAMVVPKRDVHVITSVLKKIFSGPHKEFSREPLAVRYRCVNTNSDNPIRNRLKLDSVEIQYCSRIKFLDRINFRFQISISKSDLDIIPIQ